MQQSASSLEVLVLLVVDRTKETHNSTVIRSSNK